MNSAFDIWVRRITIALTTGLLVFLSPFSVIRSAESLKTTEFSLPQTSTPKKKPPKRKGYNLSTIPHAELDPNEPRPIAAPIDPVVSLRLLEAEIKSTDSKVSQSQTPKNDLPVLSQLPSQTSETIITPLPSPVSAEVTAPTVPELQNRTPNPTALKPQATETIMVTTADPKASDKARADKKFIPPPEVISIWLNLRATTALGELSRAMVLQKWQLLTADRTESKSAQKGFQSLLNVTAVLVDGRDHRLALETIRQRSRVWLAVQNGYDFMNQPQDSELLIAAEELQNPNYRPPTNYDDLRGVLLLQGLSCPLVTRFIKIAHDDWLVSCSNGSRFRINLDAAGQISAFAYEWRE